MTCILALYYIQIMVDRSILVHKFSLRRPICQKFWSHTVLHFPVAQAFPSLLLLQPWSGQLNPWLQHRVHVRGAAATEADSSLQAWPASSGRAGGHAMNACNTVHKNVKYRKNRLGTKITDFNIWLPQTLQYIAMEWLYVERRCFIFYSFHS